MGWTVSYQFVRATSLTADERATLVKVVAAEDRRSWDGEGFGLAVARGTGGGGGGVLATGSSKLGGGLEDRDAAQMVAAINAALAALPGAELRLFDDFEVFGVEDGRCSLTGVPTADLVEDEGDLIAVRDLVAPDVPEPLAGILAGRARGEAPPPVVLNAKLVKLAFKTIKGLKYDHPSHHAIQDLLRAIPRDRLIECGFKDLKTIVNNPAIGAFYEALDATEDVAPLVPAFLAAWHKPGGLYWYGDLGFTQRTWDRLARDPRVIAAMTADLAAVTLDADETVHRRAERAAQVLARSGDPDALRTVIAMVRRWRLDKLPTDLEYRSRDGAVRALCDHGGAAGFATLALELERHKSAHRRGALGRGLARLDPTRATPIVVQLLDGSAGHTDLAYAAAAIGGADGATMLARIAALPVARVRDWLPRLCREHGIEPPAIPPLPPDEERLVHVAEDARQEALDALIARHDRALFEALVWAEALHRALQNRERGSSSGPNWNAWKDLVPDKILHTSAAKQLAWAAGEGAAILGPQTRIAALVPIMRAGLPGALADFPTGTFRFTDDERAAFLAEEAAHAGA